MQEHVRMTYLRALLVPLVMLAACGGGDDAATADAAAVPDAAAGGCTADELVALEAAMRASLDAAALDPAITSDPVFTVMLDAGDGRRFVHSHGASTPTTVYESASTSKWVTAAVILELVDRGALALDTTAHELIPFWAETAVDLRDLLSFTSGFVDEPLCMNLPGADYAECTETMYEANAATAAAPGTEYQYSGTHMQAAGLMAMRATDSTWAEIVAGFQARTGLFPTAAYDLPSATNPRLGGGMHWTAEEYLGFLRALADGAVLSDASRAAMHANQRGDAVVLASPAWQEMEEDWSYGLGNWLECPTATELGGYDCGEGHRNSSAGAYGAYPFIDFDHDHVGIVARQGDLGSGGEGVAIARSIAEPAARWAERRCD
jgi:CubicO group peptidase (beta-lactamase class C family)